VTPLPVPEPEPEEPEAEEAEEEPAEKAEEEAAEEVKEEGEEAAEAEELDQEPEAEPEGPDPRVPADAYDLPLLTLGLPPELESALGEANFHNVGELTSAILSNPDVLQMQEGIGPEDNQTIIGVVGEMTGLDLQGGEEDETGGD